MSMLTRGYVCRSCQLKELRRTTNTIATQWQGRAAYISLSQAPPGSGDATDGRHRETTRLHENHLLNKGDYESTKRTRSQNLPPKSTKTTVQPQPGRYSGAAVSLPFQNSYARDSRDLQGRQEHRQSAGIAVKLDSLLDSSDDLPQAWSFFLENYPKKGCAALVNPAYQDLGHLQYGEVFKKLLRVLSTGWATRPDELPRPTRIVQRLRQLNIWRPEFWDFAAWPIARRLFVMHQQEQVPEGTILQDLSSELLEWWVSFVARHITQAGRTDKAHETPSINWPALHQKAMVNRDTLRKSYDFEVRFYGFFHGLAPEAKRRLSTLTLISIDLLSKPNIAASVPTERRVDHAGLLKMLLLLVDRRNVSRPAESLRKALADSDGAISPLVIDDYVRHMHQLPDRALAMTVSIDAQLAPDAEADEGSGVDAERFSPEERTQQLFSSYIQRAQTQQNPGRLQQIWRNIQSSYASQESGHEKLAIPALLYDQMISAMFAARKGDAALEIWQTMVRNGTNPTTKTWTAMLDGANKGKDWAAADSIWQRMLDSGVALDQVSWVVRMTTLVRNRRYDEALESLEDMGRRWIEESNGDGVAVQAVQPNMKIVNTVIQPLAMRTNRRLLTKVLEWARRFGLEPDVRTYNFLMSAAVAKGNSSETGRLLQQMSEQGIEPDEATYSILLDDILVNSFSSQLLDPEQIQTKAFEALETFESQGLKANNVIYAQLIDRLLKKHDNLPAAEAVLSHMLKKGLEPSEHAYTSLITHYFSLRPPDIGAVNHIVDRLQTKFRNVNTYFYDRVLQGYAAAGSIELAMRTLRRMSNEQRNPSWQALHALVLALERAGELNLLGELLVEVENREKIKPLSSGKGSSMKSTFYGVLHRLRAEGKIAPDAKVSEDTGRQSLLVQRDEHSETIASPE